MAVSGAGDGFFVSVGADDHGVNGFAQVAGAEERDEPRVVVAGASSKTATRVRPAERQGSTRHRWV